MRRMAGSLLELTSFQDDNEFGNGLLCPFVKYVAEF